MNTPESGLNSEYEQIPLETYEAHVPYFGRAAVEAELRRTAAVLEGDETATAEADAALGEAVQEVRQYLAYWIYGEAANCPDEDARDEASSIIRLLEKHDVAFLPPSLADDHQEGTLRWIDGLDEERLLNFLQWNRHRAMQASAALAALQLGVEILTLEDVDTMDEQLQFSVSVTQRVAMGMRRNRAIVAMDAFEAGNQLAMGMNYQEDWVIGLRKAFQPDTAMDFVVMMHTIIVHEHIHAADEIPGGGLWHILAEREGRPALTWFNEAVVEHIALTAAFGLWSQFDEIAPEKRNGPDGSYLDGRRLLDTVLTHGDVVIDPRLLVEAYFEPLAVTDGYRALLDKQLRDSFATVFPDLAGQNIVEVIAAEYNAAPRSQKAAVLERWERKILEATGNVVWTDEDDVPTNMANLVIYAVPTDEPLS